MSKGYYKDTIDAEFARSPAGIYVPGGWGANWRTALAASATTPARVACVGDSITLGHWGSTLAKTYVGVLSAALQAKYGNGGSGYHSVSHSPAINAPLSALPTSDQVVYVGGSPSTYQDEGPAAMSLGTVASYGSAQTLTFQGTGRNIRVWYVPNTGNGSFSWTIDGVSQGTVSTGTGGPANASFTSVAATVASSGAHTVVVTVAAGQATVFISGVSFTNDTGVVVYRFGKAGCVSAAYNNHTTTFGPSAQYSGGELWTPGPAHLAIYALGVNDAMANITEATYLQNVYLWAKAIKEGATRGGKVDLIFMLPHIGSYEGTSLLYGQYAKGVRGIAEHFGAAFVNVAAASYNQSRAYGLAQNYFGTSSPMGSPGTDAVHPSDIGHAAIASLLNDIVLV